MSKGVNISHTDYDEEMIHLAVFDLDGTLVDSRADLATAVNDMLRGLGAPGLPEAAVGEMVGEGAAVLVRRALAASGLDPALPDALDRFLAAYDRCLLDTTRPYDGMVDTLEGLFGRVPLAVLTNKPTHATGRVLDGLQLRQYFAHVLGGDTPLGRKPHPEGLTSLASGAGVAPAATLLVGDSAVDLETARRAGTKICLARYGFGYRFAPGAFRGDEMFIGEPRALLDCSL